MRRRKSILPSIRLLTCIALACNAGFGCEKPPQGASTPEQLLASYRENLAAVRQRFGGSRDMPAPRFLLFGMGLREKYLYRSGTLIRLSDRETVERWQNSVELIVPPEYLVRVMAPDGSTLSIREDERAVWLEKAGARVPLPGTEVPVELPKFEGHRYGPILRVLHHEMLIGVLSTGQHRGGPVPNLFKFGKPWYRDAAVIAHALAGTGNLDSVRPWIASLAEPYDHNRSPEIEEADNLGQALYLLSLIGAKDHPLVPALLMELAEHEAAQEGHRYITGITDGEAHPAYQTKWAKLGLQRLGLPDPYEVPAILDGYSPVFWLDYRSAYPEKNPDARDLELPLPRLGGRPLPRNPAEPVERRGLPADLGGRQHGRPHHGHRGRRLSRHHHTSRLALGRGLPVPPRIPLNATRSTGRWRSCRCWR